MTIQADNTETREGQRIAKVMARAGLCSRRDAEQWIAEGRVSVNGEVLTSPAFNVGDADDVRVDGQPLKAAERTRLFLFHKPRGLVTTAKDPEGRPTIFDALPQDLPRVVTIGRLDINTEGLLLLTNDGGLARLLELPTTGWLRRYRVRAHGEITQATLDGLRDGITLDGVDYRGIEARFERQQGSNVWLTMGLREGKNREIKRVLEHLGLSVNRLIRVSFGPFELADLAEGEVVETPTRVLRDQLGPKLAKQAGANFEAPIEARPAEPVETSAERPQFRPREQPHEGPPRKRKHVSVLRAEARAEAEGPRKRVARAITSDRRGREVKVERVSLARPPAPTAERAPRQRKEFTRPPREGAERKPREGFAGARPPRRDGEAGGRPPRDGAQRKPREDFAGARPARRDGEAGARPPREGAQSNPRESFAGARPPRREGEAGGRPPRDGAQRKPREGFAGARPARRDGEAGARPPRDGAERKPREGFAGARPPRRDGEAGARPPRDGAARKPREGFAGARPPRRDGEAGARPPREGAQRKPREGFAGARPPRRDGEAATRKPREGFAGARPPRRDGEAGGRPPRGPGKGPPRGKPGPRAR